VAREASPARDRADVLFARVVVAARLE